jgi:transcriptional regulator with XRE-family HTH domain
VGRKGIGAPDGLALAVAEELVRIRNARGISTRSLAASAEMSEKYLRDRMNFTLTMTIADVERLCSVMSLGDPGQFIADVEIALQGAPQAEADNVTPIRKDVPTEEEALELGAVADTGVEEVPEFDEDPEDNL